MQEPTFLNCCDATILQTVRVLYESNHDLEALKVCTACNTYWFYRFNEYVNWCGGDDDMASWYTRLSPDEGDTLRHNGRSAVDLTFLLDRPSWMDDRDGVRRVAGAPDRPGS